MTDNKNWAPGKGMPTSPTRRVIITARTKAAALEAAAKKYPNAVLKSQRGKQFKFDVANPQPQTRRPNVRYSQPSKVGWKEGAR